MKQLFCLAALAIAVSACGSETGSGEASKPAAPEASLASLNACDAIRRLGEGMEATPPFDGLSQLDETSSFPDQRVTELQPFGTVCKHGVLSGWNDGDPSVHIFRCTIFEASSMMYEEEKPNAEAAFNEAKETLDKCLPDGWTAREHELSGGGTDEEAFVFERASDVERSDSGQMYYYPILLQKAFFRSPQSRGGPWGWIVDVAFQQPEAAPPSE